MKLVLLTLSGLLICQSTFARGIRPGCAASEVALQDAQKALAQVETLVNDGMGATKLDTLLAKKHVLELQLCGQWTDISLYEELAKTVAERSALAQAQVKAGTLNFEVAISATSEAAGMAIGCTKILGLLTKQVSAGYANQGDVNTVKEACDILSASVKEAQKK